MYHAKVPGASHSVYGRGERLLQQSAAQQGEAEECVQQALAMARRQPAKSMERRAAAHELLAEVYGWCIEGFDTADVQEAKVLLQELGA